jgi:uncharacterized protein
MASMIRTVDVFKLAREGGSVEGQFEVVELARLAPMLAPPLGRIQFRFQGRIDEQGRDAATLRIQGQLALNCDLCGSPLQWVLDESAGFFFVDDEEQLGALPIEADTDEPLLGSRTFDLRSLVEDQAILALPISPRHPACLRPEPAGSAEHPVHRPFEVLAAHKRGRTDIQ